MQEITYDGLETIIARLDPAELIYPHDHDIPDWVTDSQICATEQAASLFDPTVHAKHWRDFTVGKPDGLGNFNRPMLSAGWRASWLY